jgi:hypothetical protein
MTTILVISIVSAGLIALGANEFNFDSLNQD